jgi:hypothetical protein
MEVMVLTSRDLLFTRMEGVGGFVILNEGVMLKRFIMEKFKVIEVVF